MDRIKVECSREGIEEAEKFGPTIVFLLVLKKIIIVEQKMVMVKMIMIISFGYS